MHRFPWLPLLVHVAVANAHANAHALAQAGAQGAAQEPARREPVRGSAVAADGAAWAGAQVTLWSRPLPGDERLGAADEVRATTDDKGRFTVQLLPGRSYLAFAATTLDGGREQVSFPVDDAIAGQPLELVADAPRERKRLVLTNAAPWRQRGRLEVTMMSATLPAVIHTVVATEDTLALPLLPGRSARVLATCDGLPLQQWPQTVDLTRGGDATMKLQAPRQVRVRVLDPSGAPVANASLSLGTIDPSGGARELTAALGRTGADGDAVVCLPLPEARVFRWVNYTLGVDAAGLAPVRIVGNVDIAAGHDAATGEPAVVIRLERGAQHRVRVVDGGRALAVPVMLRTLGASPDGNTQGPFVRHVQPDAEGRFELSRRHGVPVVVLADAQRLPAAAAAAVRGSLHPVALLGRIRRDHGAAEVTFDAARLRPLALQVVDDGGTPLAAARVAVLLDDRQPETALTGLRTDRAGRCAALVPPDVRLAVVAWSSEGCAVASGIDTSAAAAADAAPIPLRLARVASLPGSVVGRDGEPAAFARVVAHVSGQTGADARRLACALDRVAATTARDGTFRLPLYPGLAYSLRGVVMPDGDHYCDGQWTVGQDEPEHLSLDLRKAR